MRQEYISGLVVFGVCTVAALVWSYVGVNVTEAYSDTMVKIFLDAIFAFGFINLALFQIMKFSRTGSLSDKGSMREQNLNKSRAIDENNRIGRSGFLWGFLFCMILYTVVYIITLII